ncbi:MAG TPA: hypothetical protein VL405_07470 [Sphingomonas sp.]|nr:hypothetical protein [Sphingomonas sp.]
MIEFTTGDIDTFGLYLTLGFTARDGRYYPGHANAIAGFKALGGATGADPSGDYALRFKRTQVIDHETGLQIFMNAPADVRMVTPITAILVAPGSTAAKLKTQLGITGSLFGMVTDPDLATYDAIAESASGDAARAADAARMHAANLRVLAIISALKSIPAGSGYKEPGIDLTFGEQTDAMAAKCLASAPTQFIFQNDRMASLIQCYLNALIALQPSPPPYLQLSALKIQAVAHLINGYAAAMPVRLETSTEKARWLLGINGYLRAMVGRIVADPTDATAQAVLAVTATSPTILSETSRYTEFYRYNDTGLYMTSPDFLVLTDTATITVDAVSLTGNDAVLANGNVNTRGFDRADGTIQSVAVPAANASQITVVKSPAGNYTVTALNGFKGVSYFDYDSKAVNNETRTTRVYVRVM